MSESLNVIALISGGKDSFYSILHCLQNGHKVVALANLYPPEPSLGDAEEHDLNSFMYQTVGHTVIPLYEQALGIPLYRQHIVGSAVQTGTSYGYTNKEESPRDEQDETESLLPLLRKIMQEHPEANALSTGAIMSTYQRTRIESIALRLNLTPLSFLWQYPVLPPGTQISLLQDMHAVNLDARIIKVASGGLDESFLWENVASVKGMGRVERVMRRFGVDGDGAVIGEGGEFETLVVDGPECLFKGRIVVKEEDRRVVQEGGGSAWLQILKAEVVMKSITEAQGIDVRIPSVLEERFEGVLRLLNTEDENTSLKLPSKIQTSYQSSSTSQNLFTPHKQRQDITYWTIYPDQPSSPISITDEATSLISQIRQRLSQSSLQPTSIISATIILRSMTDFTTINPIYGTLFTSPNPPSRVTIASGTAMPPGINMLIHLKLQSPSSLPTPARKALHVQSRSYWAPANIGPYSQAIFLPIPSPPSSQYENETPVYEVHIAGQIPLIPHTMLLPSEDFSFQTVLALQHLFRIGREMNVRWWTSAVAYLPSSLPFISEKAAIACKAWTLVHTPPSQDEEEEEEERDLWEEKHLAGMQNRGAEKEERNLPDFSLLQTSNFEDGAQTMPPFFAVEVEELPRQAMIEWHAHLGIAGASSVRLASRRGHGWTVYQSAFSGVVESVVAVDFFSNKEEVRMVLDEALTLLAVGKGAGAESYMSYLDMNVIDIWSLEDCGGKVPCKRIWSAEGRRLAVVLLFSSTS